MHKTKHIWSHCDTCNKGETYTAKTVHKRVKNCECGNYIVRRTLSLNYEPNYIFEEYAIAWGA